MMNADASEPPSLEWHALRVWLEAQTPLSCASGSEGVADTLLNLDANGLPQIPGATLQGVLKHYWQKRGCKQPEHLLFGSAETPAQVWFGSGSVLGTSHQTAGFPLEKPDQLQDLLMREAPVLRDHVRLNHRHTAQTGAKFDRSAVPAGTRFVFDLWARGPSDQRDTIRTLKTMVSALNSPLVRIGGRGKRGYGRMRIIGWDAKSFKTCDGLVLQDWRKPGARRLPVDALASEAASPCRNVLQRCDSLRPINPWRIGSLLDVVQAAGEEAGTRTETRSMRERRVVWLGEVASIEEPTRDNLSGYILPGSAIAGPLRHRTLYHYCRAQGIWADASAECKEKAIKAVQALFGEEGGLSDDKLLTGNASVLFVDDVPITFNVSAVTEAIGPRTRVSIDRFTGGARQGALVTDHLIDPEAMNPLAVSIYCDEEDWNAVEQSVRDAFELAWIDLTEGALALGGGSLGFCEKVPTAPPAPVTKAIALEPHQ